MHCGPDGLGEEYQGDASPYFKWTGARNSLVKQFATILRK